MANKNFETNRRDFENHFKQRYPQGSVKRNDSGQYIDKDAYYGWAAYCKAFAQYAHVIRSGNANNGSVYLIGRDIPGIPGEPGNPSAGREQTFKFGKNPHKHKSLIKAETERQRLLKAYPEGKFTLFVKISADPSVQELALEYMQENTLKHNNQCWYETNNELLSLQTAIIEAQEAKDETKLTTLRQRCVNLHHERIALNIQRLKLMKEKQNA